MIKPKYNIGDVVYVGEWKSVEINETCPECGGTGTLKVTLFDGTEYNIECEGCKRGYMGPLGFVSRISYRPTVAELVIQGMELGCFSSEKGIWQYRLGLEGNCYRQIPEHEIFLDEQAAMQFAIAKGRQLEINDATRALMKDKPTKTWAFNVTYHRREIKRAEKNLEYHTRKLGIAKAKTKETP